MSHPIVTIGIPVYNSEKTIRESIESALAQECKGKEVLVIDDGSTDSTYKICKEYKIRVLKNEKNLGIGVTLARLIKEASGHYIVFLCGDDQFTDNHVVQDYVRQFQVNKGLGVIGRYYYQYMDGHPGPIMVCRDRNIFTSSCNPSGMGFRKEMGIRGINDIFIECPAIVAQYLRRGHSWTMLEYDTIRARIHPGGNTGTKEEYYQGSMYENWYKLLGEPLKFYQGLIQVKNRAPKNLWKEMGVCVRVRPLALVDPLFLIHALIAIVVPGKILKPLSNFYRHRITRRFLKTIPRRGGNNV